MPEAKYFKCRVLENVWITPSVIRMRFQPSKKFDFEPGQFLSVVVPPGEGDNTKPVKRCYSFAGGPEESKKNGYELCVKVVPGGLGSTYLSSLRPGDYITVYGPYGDFLYKLPPQERSLCFISTGTGIAPFRSILHSKLFKESPPRRVLAIQGARTEDELLFRGEFEAMGLETVYAVSHPDASWGGFRGRVTDFLRTLPQDWLWHSTDFYMCGNGPMVTEVNEILRGGHGVAEKSIHQEKFSLVAPQARPLLVPVSAKMLAPRPIVEPSAPVEPDYPLLSVQYDKAARE